MDETKQISGEVSARDILKLLQIGKIVTVQVSTPVEFSNLRSRIATLKSSEDHISIGLGLYEEAPTLSSACREVIKYSNMGRICEGIHHYDCTFQFTDKVPVKTYSIVSVE